MASRRRFLYPYIATLHECGTNCDCQWKFRNDTIRACDATHRGSVRDGRIISFILGVPCFAFCVRLFPCGSH